MQAIVDSSEVAAEAVGALIDKVNELDAALRALPDMKRVQIVVDTVGGTGDAAGGGLGGIAPEAEAAANAVHDLGIAWTEEEARASAAAAAAAANAADEARAAATAEQETASLTRLRQAYADAFAGIDPMTRATDSYREALQSLNVEELRNWEVSGGVISANRIIGRTVTDTAAAVDQGNRAWAVQIGWFRLTATALHWIVAGSLEFLAVAIPAAVGLGAGLAVAAQGAQNAYTHFSALYDATESTYGAMGKTVGTVLGLGDALQKAQDAANPGVYEILGSAINDAKGSFQSLAGVGLQVVHMFDEFAARVTVDLQNGMGTQIQNLLSGMVGDLRQFGEILGNLGHALLNFASAMPGLAHFLLGVAEALSSVIEEASRFGTLITFAMGMEEMYRWGGLALNLLVRLTGQMAVMNAMGATNFITRFGAAILTLGSGLARALTAVGSFIAGIGILPGLTSRVGAGLQTMGAEMDEIATSMSPAMVAGIAGIVGAMAGLILMSSHLKDNLQQTAANAVTAVKAASDANFAVVAAAQYAKLSNSVQQVNTSLSHMSTGAREAGAVASSSWAQWSPMIAGFGGLGRLTAGFGQQISALGAGFAKMPTPVTGAVGAVLSFFGAFAPAAKASADLTALHAAEAAITGTTQTFGANIGFLGTQFHTTAVGALALANAAGVNLTQGLLAGTEQGKIAVQMIDNLKTGLGAMSAPAGVIGADMSAVGIQSALAASKVQTVNQAMDAFVGMTTGGMNAVMQFNAAIHAMGNDTVSSSQSINGAISTISANAAKMGFTLQGIGPHAQQSWQQFDAAVQQGNSVLDTMRIGMAANVVSFGQYKSEIQAVGGSLLPFAAHNRTALSIVSQFAQELGLPFTHNLKTLAADFGITGKAAQNMATTGAEKAAAELANLNTVARNLSVTVGSQLDSAMSAAIVKASNLSQAYGKWATDLMNKAPANTMKSDAATITQKLDLINTAVQQGTKLLNSNKTAVGDLGGAYKTASGAASDAAGAVKKSSDALQGAEISAKTASLTTQGFGQQAHTAAGTAQGLATNAQQATTQVKNLGTAANTTRGNLGTVNNEIHNTATYASNTTGPLSGMIGNIRTVGSSAQTAAGQVHALATAMAGLQSKSITLTTNMVTVTSTIHRQHGGPVVPGVPYTVGEAGSELFVPSQAGYIVPHDETVRMIGTPQAAAGATGGFGNHGSSEVHSHITVNLDGRQLWKGIQSEMLRWQVRNSGRPTGLTVPQAPGPLT